MNQLSLLRIWPRIMKAVSERDDCSVTLRLRHMHLWIGWKVKQMRVGGREVAGCSCRG